MPLRLFPTPVLPLPDFIHRHFYRHFDTIHSGKPGDRIQATGYSSPQILCLSSSPLSYD